MVILKAKFSSIAFLLFKYFILYYSFKVNKIRTGRSLKCTGIGGEDKKNKGEKLQRM